MYSILAPNLVFPDESELEGPFSDLHSKTRQSAGIAVSLNTKLERVIAILFVSPA
jgi:hypothetical protein